MKAVAVPAHDASPAVSAVSRRDLSRLINDLATDIGADSYLLVELAYERGRERVIILASNWVYDAVEHVGLEGIAALTADDCARRPGESPRAVAIPRNPALSKSTCSALLEHGHAEFFCQKLHAGKRRIYAMFSAAKAKRMDGAAVSRAQMICGYAFAKYAAGECADVERNPLSERQRECLRWVSEGKTTDEVALILGVSSNTVNSYVAHAIQKFGAANRAMAIATAIRGGVI